MGPCCIFMNSLICMSKTFRVGEKGMPMMLKGNRMYFVF